LAGFITVQFIPENVSLTTKPRNSIRDHQRHELKVGK